MTDRPPARRLPDPLSARGRSPGRGRGGPDPLEQGLDRLVTAGRQLVDGVAGTRPGSRGGARAGERPRLAGLGRWVEEKLDWILEDEDDWREPWQQPERGPQRRPAPPFQPLTQQPMQPPAAARSAKRPLDAISRRRAPSATGPETAGTDTAGPDTAWPDDDSFSLPRWQRPAGMAGRREPAQPQPPADRPLPRSSRRRQG